MKKLLLLITLLSAFSAFSTAQHHRIKGGKNRLAFDWGAKVGFNSSLPIINSLNVNGQEIENVQVQYNVGYMASLFWRVNLGRVFLQPSVSWHRTSSDLQYDISAFDPSVDRLTMERIKVKTQSIAFPMLIGYSIVKEGPFGLSMTAGPNISYNYDTSFRTSHDDYHNSYGSSDKSCVSLVTGVGVKLWGLYFDFTYEFGLNRTESDFKNTSDIYMPPLDMSIDSRTNMIGFSLGFLF
jgi:hypothetical protein